MGVVSQNKGVLVPLPGQMLSEVAIISGVAIATLGDRTKTDWVAMTENYDRIRDHISRVIPGFENFNEKLRRPGAFTCPMAHESGSSPLKMARLTSPPPNWRNPRLSPTS
jgi:hypothetical protein